MLNARLRRVPWVLWLHDILPDGAAATGLVDDGPVLRAARALERLAYREADRIVVLSQRLHAQPRGQGRARGQDRADLRPGHARAAGHAAERQQPSTAHALLSMGNIGFSQGLTGS